MYIQPINYSVNMQGGPSPKGDPKSWRKFLDKIQQKIIDSVPEKTFNDLGKRREWERINNKISHPATNRLIMGATALATQPAIDYYNHRVDKETREISRNRTIAKIIVGTGVGMAVRGSCYELVKKMTDIKGIKKYSKTLLPTSKDLSSIINDHNLLSNYRNALATSLAILAMCITNFVIDAPLTVMLTNHFNSKRKAKAPKQQERKVYYA